MLTVRATYNNGAVQWRRKPRLKGNHEVLITFMNEDDSVAPSKSHSIHSNDEEWTTFALSNLENAYGNDEPEYTDDMLKTRNPEFRLR